MLNDTPKYASACWDLGLDKKKSEYFYEIIRHFQDT